jgi:exoribonuclease II
MSDHAHADHRPRVGEDPSELGESPPGTTMLGALYPLHDVLAVLPDRPAAERAVQALKEAGVPEGDVDLLDGAWFVAAMRELDRRGGLAGRLTKWLHTYEQLLMRRYVAEAEQGHNILVVHAEDPADVERVQRVLRDHGAREMRHYGGVVVTDL